MEIFYIKSLLAVEKYLVLSVFRKLGRLRKTHSFSGNTNALKKKLFISKKKKKKRKYLKPQNQDCDRAVAVRREDD